ncbi:glycosyltransferase [Ornithinicoccus halotolerans]|uniref:glycosyltransferase n=1 Tax=Ornithinicoccus halotolerans TaxID=1748220 RepID=UPI001294DAC7
MPPICGRDVRAVARADPDLSGSPRDRTLVVNQHDETPSRGPGLTHDHARQAANATTSPDVVVLLGTDHHPFDRLVDWADTWASQHPDRRVFVQYGHSRAPRVAAGVSILDQAGLRGLVQSSRAVIAHGGPGTMVDARTSGHTPVVVPRDPRRGEHVDDHQQRFARWAAKMGLVQVLVDTADLDATVEQELTSPTPLSAGAGDPHASVQSLVHLLQEEPVGPIRRLWRRSHRPRGNHRPR